MSDSIEEIVQPAPRPLSPRLSLLMGETIPPAVIDEARELLRRKRVLDFLVQPGRVSAKVHDETGRSLRIEVNLAELSDEVWQKAFDRLSEHALYLAMLLAGRLPVEVERLFLDLGFLYPVDPEELSITVNGAMETPEQAYVTAVIFELYERLDEDPFAIFLLRGRGRDETLLELQQRRQRVRAKEVADTQQHHTEQTNARAVETLSAAAAGFWSTGKKLESLSYFIRADELPASILKWLDPLPLGGLDADVDFRLEEAYERIARLAQSYGLGL